MIFFLLQVYMPTSFDKSFGQQEVNKHLVHFSFWDTSGKWPQKISVKIGISKSYLPCVCQWYSSQRHAWNTPQQVSRPNHWYSQCFVTFRRAENTIDLVCSLENHCGKFLAGLQQLRQVLVGRKNDCVLCVPHTFGSYIDPKEGYKDILIGGDLLGLNVQSRKMTTSD